MDVEEYARRQIRGGKEDDVLQKELASIVHLFKPEEPMEYTRAFAQAVIEEVKATEGLTGDYFSFVPAQVKMGEFGVGSRGSGDFFVHRQIARIIGKTGVSVGVDELDDAGAVEVTKEKGGLRYIVCTVDGMHSRLSDFPFLAGFHVARATLRDAYVMGARPIMLFSDIHVADDGDVAKIFDYTAGICTVGELMEVPLVAGSTLRIGGDMVLGQRLTGCVGTVGISKHLTARRETRPGDVVLMTEGAGGGTIATAALYSGYPGIVDKTINLQFLRAADALLESPVMDRIHSMTDVTNGGLRGDAHEMAQTARCRILIEQELVGDLVQPDVRHMLDDLEIDYLGVSLDSLLLTLPQDAADEVISVVEAEGVRIREIGRVEAGSPEAVLVVKGREKEFSPRFRESAYTPVKKVADRHPKDPGAMQAAVLNAADEAVAKKNRVVQRLKIGI
ncbi:MAG: AIR synthase related protein [Methanoregulaceae archaeon]|nr:AIR synthase related protein [Methanoregulaceae archaeon]